MEEALKFSDVVMEEGGGGVSFSVAGGTMVAVITSRQEESDCLVRLLLGLSKPGGGSIMMLGEDVTRAGYKSLLSLRRRVGVVHPGGGLVSNLKTWENLVLPLEYHSGCSQAEVEQRGLAALGRVRYSGELMALPAHLSLYEKRIVGVARAMLTEPRLMIYNSILAGLRAQEKDNLLGAARDFQRANPERTSLFLTSNPEFVEEIGCDSRIFLKGSSTA